MFSGTDLKMVLNETHSNIYYKQINQTMYTQEEVWSLNASEVWQKKGKLQQIRELSRARSFNAVHASRHYLQNRPSA